MTIQEIINLLKLQNISMEAKYDIDGRVESLQVHLGGLNVMTELDSNNYSGFWKNYEDLYIYATQILLQELRCKKREEMVSCDLALKSLSDLKGEK